MPGPERGRHRQDEPLKTYNEKRRFEDTPEPRGVLGEKGGTLYTIQKHAARRLHYDLRLELNGVLLSWAITKGPSLDPSQKRLAVRTEDHPLDYATFEGRIPASNYGAGTVLLWDKGLWEPIGDPGDGLKKGKLSFHLRGKRLKGRWALVRFKGNDPGKRENWLLIKENDAYAERDTEVTETETKSVASGRAMQAIADDTATVWENGKKTQRKRKKSAAALPSFHKPALATLVDDIPEGDEWRYEVKFDGYRSISAVSGGAVRIYSRSGLDWTDRYEDIADALGELKLDRVLLDGEIVALDSHGRADFSRLQDALKTGSGALSYFIFDLLEEGGKSLRKQPLSDRKARLNALLKGLPRRGPLFYVDEVADGKRMLDKLCNQGWEGIIAKRMNAPYRSGRNRDWLKIKCGRDQEFVLVGWSPSDKDRPFASVLLGQYQDGNLVYAGRVGTGFSDAELDRLAARFRSLARKTSPLEALPPSTIARNAKWIRPELVAQVAFTELTREGYVRHGRYLGLRDDKAASDVKPEEPQEMPTAKSKTQSVGANEDTLAGVRLTHPDRVLFSGQGITKRDLAEYLDAAADRMLEHCARRLISLVRCPQGRTRKCFFQRHAGAGLPDAFKQMDVAGGQQRTESYLYLTNRAGLVAAAQMGVLELHIWGSHIDDIERPDRIVFDLDPDHSVSFPAVREAAVGVRDALDALGLRSFALLTGGKGIHVVAPIMRHYEWPVIKAFTKALAGRFADHAPDHFTANMSKAKRKGRIFIDYLRNDRSATAIAPYAPRARENAPVAWPVAWDELGTFDAANAVTIPQALERLASPDPWQEYASVRQGLKLAALKSLGISVPE